MKESIVVYWSWLYRVLSTALCAGVHCAVPFSVPSIGDGPVVVSLDCSLVVEYVVHCKTNSAYLYNMAIDLHSYAKSHG